MRQIGDQHRGLAEQLQGLQTWKGWLKTRSWNSRFDLCRSLHCRACGVEDPADCDKFHVMEDFVYLQRKGEDEYKINNALPICVDPGSYPKTVNFAQKGNSELNSVLTHFYYTLDFEKASS
jgi:hypothetical protein